MLGVFKFEEGRFGGWVSLAWAAVGRMVLVVGQRDGVAARSAGRLASRPPSRPLGRPAGRLAGQSRRIAPGSLESALFHDF